MSESSTSPLDANSYGMEVFSDDTWHADALRSPNLEFRPQSRLGGQKTYSQAELTSPASYSIGCRGVAFLGN